MFHHHMDRPTANYCPGVQDKCPGAVTGCTLNTFLSFINVLYAAKCTFDTRPMYPEDYSYKLRNYDSYDFIVVGAGSAGSVIANRLSEDPKSKVLLLEAGHLPSSGSEVPAFFFSDQQTRQDWQYTTEPSPQSCKGFKNNVCRWPSGKCLGGSSTLNAMMYVRGSDRDFDNWEAAGNTGWSYKDVLKYFLKSQDVRRSDYIGNPNHSSGGYLTTTYTPGPPKLRNIILNSVQELGTTFENDAIYGNGMYECLLTTDNGRRCSTAKAFISKIRRTNLDIALNSHITRIIIKNKVAVGVIAYINNRRLELYAQKEVIVSAGAINSPQLLMLSGIGPKGHLKEHGIPLIKDSPVGENLQDHLTTFGVFLKLNQSAVTPITTDDLLVDTFNYYTNGQGSFGSVSITNMMWYFNLTNPTAPYGDIQTLFFSHPYGVPNLLPIEVEKVGYKPEIGNTLLAANQQFELLQISTVLIHPASRGTVRLISSNPLDKPIINPNYFGDARGDDKKTLLGAIKRIQELVNTPEMKKYDTSFLDVNVTECGAFSFASEEYWDCHLEHTANTLYHPVGTCKMGPESDPEAVVDPRMRVYGVKNLRVCDGSSMPVITSGNTNAPIIMMAEKTSDMIKEDWDIPVRS